MNLFFARKAPDYFLLVLVLLLTIVGLVVLASASSDLGKVKFDDSAYYLKHQMSFGLSLGILGFIVGFFINYQHYRKIAFLLLILSIVVLALVFTDFGVLARNTNRWVQLGPLRFQPAEIVKLTFVIYCAAWLAGKRKNRVSDVKTGLVPFAIVSGIISGLLIFQPATSTVVILMLSVMAMYFASGAPIRYIFYLLGVGLVLLSIIIYTTPYRLQRIMTYINDGADTQGAGYHVNQALIAIGTGNIVGVGYGQSISKLSYLPTPIDDSIFAVASEEFGFIGSSTIVILFALLVLRLLYLSHKTSDRFGSLLLVGFSCIIGFQAFVNMAAISGIIPLTGVPLPFISYGGTALAVFLTMMGISLNVSRQ
ncbi:MAG: stage sporulation protein cell division protein FtsW [Candidatus Parcubacteria bacterium]|jgi:cell division protein FtsW